MSLAMWFALGGDASLVVGVVTVRVVTFNLVFKEVNFEYGASLLNVFTCTACEIDGKAALILYFGAALIGFKKVLFLFGKKKQRSHKMRQKRSLKNGMRIMK